MHLSEMLKQFHEGVVNAPVVLSDWLKEQGMDDEAAKDFLASLWLVSPRNLGHGMKGITPTPQRWPAAITSFRLSLHGWSVGSPR